MTIKSMKQSARLKLNGNYFKCVCSALIYFVIALGLTYLLKLVTLKINQQVIETIISVIFSIISFTLALGITTNILNLADEKTKGVTKFIDNAILNFTKYVKILLHIFIKILIPLIVFLLSAFYYVGTFIAYNNHASFLCFSPDFFSFSIIIFFVALLALIYFALKYILAPYINREKPELSAKEIVENSKKLMNENVLTYIIIILSFLPYLIAMAVVLFILNRFIPAQYLTPLMLVFNSFLKPYTTITTSMFYDNIKNQKSKK